MRNVRVRLPDALADGALAAADAASDVPSGMSLPAVIRLALARLAGWPADAAQAVARPRASNARKS